MQGLPSEVLSTIFISLMAIHTYGDRCSSLEHVQWEVQKALPLVCRSWNQVAVGTPDLWTYICLNLRSTPDEMMKKLSLSGSCPLDVRISLDNTDAKPPTTQFRIAYNILVQSVDRCRSFVFDGLALCPEDVSPYIPAVLPKVVEAGYRVRVDDRDEVTPIPEEENDQP
ncbi:hypothetical protein M407DRAFT_21100 [Tulasnella calospora MUT 4182]|uniref:F-box domain-containing protein n=1 Tax=Tulasnella calospora MUT 4182 TaxID=1051891 RepID=A0A0C3L7R7_9AGAM|nr:hypothetical protein M407DRAFT_21100 [Tulasnella calospora MUT 4182]